MIRTILVRLLAQSSLLVASFAVSVVAANDLNTPALAAFFVLWTVQSLWIGGVRQVLGPAVLLTPEAPKRSLLAVAAATSGTLVAIAGLVTATLLGLDVAAAIVVSTTCATMGTYDVVRIAVSRESKSSILVISDSIVLVSTLIATCVPVLMGNGVSLHWTAAGMSAGAGLGLVALLRAANSDPRVMGFREWAHRSRKLMSVGLLEWGTFAVTGMIAIAAMMALGGSDVVAGVRLAETLAAPVALIGATVPMLGSTLLRSTDPAAPRVPRAYRRFTLILAVISTLWIAVVLIVPGTWISLIVGDNVEIARLAFSAMSLSVLVGVLAASTTLSMQYFGSLRSLSVVRVVQLVIAAPFVAIGTIAGGLLGAALSISTAALLAYVLQVFLFARDRKAHT